MSKKITKSAVINTLIELGPDADYKALLKADFEVDTPDNAPRYQAEYLYKYALSARAERMPEPSIIEYATTKVLEFVTKFPWAAVTGNNVTKKEKVAKVAAEPKAKKEKVTDLPDGTIVWFEPHQTFFLIVGGAILSRGKTVEKVKAIAERKHGYTTFLEPKLTPTEIVCNPSEPVAV